MTPQELATRQAAADAKAKTTWSVRDGTIVFNGALATSGNLDAAAAGRLEKVYDAGRVPGLSFSRARWDLLPKERYMWASVQTVRGCPKHCSFCSVWRTDGQAPRQSSADAVVEEIVELRRRGFRFIALAEEAGLIVPLGEWVIREACRRLGEMTGPGRPAPFVSVNLSMRQLQEPSLVPAVDRILKDYRFARERLQFELTETLLMQSGQSLETLQALRELGVKLVIDDFGILAVPPEGPAPARPEGRSQLHGRAE